MDEPIMGNRRRALQLWSVLVLAARTRTILSYGMVAKMTGLPNNCSDVLGYVAFYCMKNRLPLLTSLVINQETGQPSADFYDVVDVEAEHRRCFVHDWLEHGVPTLEAFDEAYAIREKLKAEFQLKKAEGA